MQQFKHWPTALQRRWLFVLGAGVAFLVIGVAVFFALDDQALLVTASCYNLRCSALPLLLPYRVDRKL